MTVVAPDFSQFSTSVIPDLPSIGLSADERQLIARLQNESLRCQWRMRVSEAYYLGEQHIKNLRIAVPKELEFLRTIVGWPALAVDPYVERLHVDGFRLPNATDADVYLGDLWTENGLDAELPLGVTDALSLECCYWMVGSPEYADEAPMATVESPLNMAVLWDLRGTSPVAAFQQYWQDQRRHATLLVPNQTVHLATDDQGHWVVVDRDEHDFGFVPVIRMANQPRTTARGGRSAITQAIRSVTDSACRDLLALEVSREFFAAPKVTLLGASESDFQDPDGNAKTAWETLVTRYNAIERDDEGNLPSIHQLTAYDPSVLLKPLEFRASQMAAMVAAPPQDLGLYTQGNPTSAEAGEVAERRRNRRARLQQATFGRSIVELEQMMIRFQNGGTLPSEFRRMEVDWTEVEEISMVSASDAVTKQIAAGSVPATSDVTLKRLGYSAVERRRLAADREVEQGMKAAQDIAAQFAPKQEPAGGNTDGR